MKLTRRTALFGAANLLLGMGAGVFATKGDSIVELVSERLAGPAAPQQVNPELANWVLSDADYALLQGTGGGALPKSDVLDIENNLDAPGPVLRELENVGLEVCITDCERDQACQGFVWAKPDHDRPGAARRCWIKSGGREQVIASPYYVSGHRSRIDSTASLEDRIAAVSAGDAAQSWATCQSCHSLAADEAGSGVGPNLHGVLGRQAGSADGFVYSEALGAAGFDWSIERIDAFLAEGEAYLPGNAMGLQPIRDPQTRAEIIMHLLRTGR